MCIWPHPGRKCQKVGFKAECCWFEFRVLPFPKPVARPRLKSPVWSLLCIDIHWDLHTFDTLFWGDQFCIFVIEFSHFTMYMRSFKGYYFKWTKENINTDWLINTEVGSQQMGFFFAIVGCRIIKLMLSFRMSSCFRWEYKEKISDNSI